MSADKALKSMLRYFYLLSLLGLTLFVGGCGIQQTTITTFSIPPGQFYFYSKNCTHCTTVNDYVALNNVKQKLFYVSQDIDTDKNALALIQVIGRQCKLSVADLAVPLFWNGSRCYVGDTDVISYFKTLK